VTAARADTACGAPPEGTFRRRRAALVPCSTRPLPSLPALVCERGGGQRHQRVRSGCGSGDEIAVNAANAACNRPGAVAALDAVSDAARPTATTWRYTT